MSDHMHLILHSGEILCKPKQQSVDVLEVQRFEQIENRNIKHARDMCHCWGCLELSCLNGAITTVLPQIQPQTI
jgi:hypothetical protein